MQRILLVCCLFAASLLTSCGFYDHRARILLHKEITQTNDSLDRMTKEWHRLLDRAVMTKNFSGLNPTRVKLAQFISRRRSVVASMELPADAEVLRQSEGNYLTAQATMATDVYPQFEAYTDLTPDDKIQNSLRLVAGDLETEIAWHLTMKKALDAFAIKYKIKSSKLVSSR